MDPVKVLLVEDHADVRTIWRRALEAQGYVVFEAPSLQAGIRGLEQSPDIVIADWILKEDTADLLLDSWLSIGDGPFLVVSGYPDVVTDDLLTKGAWHVLYKPMDPLVLTSVLQRYRSYVELRRGLEFMKKEVHRLRKLLILAVVASVGLSKLPWEEILQLLFNN